MSDTHERGHPSSFLALVVDEAPWRAALLREPPPRVRALHPSDVHVTLAFLGGVTPARALRAFEAARAISLRAMTANLGRMVPLGPEHHWTALSVLLEDADEVVAAMERVREVAAAAAGTIAETRPPLPHVTVARLHAKASAEERDAAIAWAGGSRVEAQLGLDRLALYTGRRVKVSGESAYDVVASLTLS